MADTSERGNKPPIFIIGTQRSGTTLLRLILNAHSSIAIPEEARFLAPLLNKSHLTKDIQGEALKALVRYLAANAQYKLWNYDAQPYLAWLSGKDRISLRELIDSMFMSFCHSEGKSTWGDKSLFFRTIDILIELFPDARFIHIVRDGRDVFDSWRKMDPTKNNAAVMALDWRYKLAKIERSFSTMPIGNHFTLRYEDLLEAPEDIWRDERGSEGHRLARLGTNLGGFDHHRSHAHLQIPLRQITIADDARLVICRAALRMCRQQFLKLELHRVLDQLLAPRFEKLRQRIPADLSTSKLTHGILRHGGVSPQVGLVSRNNKSTRPPYLYDVAPLTQLAFDSAWRRRALYCRTMSDGNLRITLNAVGSSTASCASAMTAVMPSTLWTGSKNFAGSNP